MSVRPLNRKEKNKWRRVRKKGFDVIKDPYGWKWVRQHRYSGEWLASRPAPKSRTKTIRDCVKINFWRTQT